MSKSLPQRKTLTTEQIQAALTIIANDDPPFGYNDWPEYAAAVLAGADPSDVGPNA